MNKVILMGRLTREPDVRYTQGGNTMCIARYTLAVDRRFSRNSSDGNNADFISCVAFGKSGEFAEKYLHKGTKVAVTGRLQTGSYTNRDGVKVYTTDVIIEDQEFAESKRAAASNAGSFEGFGGYGNGGGSDSAYNRNGGSSYAGGRENSGSSGSGNDRVDGSSSQEQSPDSLSGFMNIPDGIDEELPFA